MTRVSISNTIKILAASFSLLPQVLQAASEDEVARSAVTHCLHDIVFFSLIQIR